jgi:hypothetical protein
MAKMVKREVLIGTIVIGNKTVRVGENATVDEETAEALAADGILAREPAKVAPKAAADEKDDGGSEPQIPPPAV